MDVKALIHDSLEKLKKLGIDAMAQEEKIASWGLNMPQEILESMESEQFLGMILSMVGARTETGPAELYSFDVEVMDVSDMYTRFLESISGLSHGELVITDIEEVFSTEVFEAGKGIQPVKFLCNGTAYQYEAKVEYDWFDTGILTFMEKVIEEQNTGSHLFVTSDGYQECIVFYRTKEWAQQFYDLFHVELECP